MKNVKQVIVGLGNNEPELQYTRHNMGRQVLESGLRRDHLMDFDDYAIEVCDCRAFLVDDTMYVEPAGQDINDSGRALKHFLTETGLLDRPMTVIYDDLDMPEGKVRYRTKGSAGGHNGVQDIIDHFGTQDFARLKVGIGRPPKGTSVYDWVRSGDVWETSGEVTPVLTNIVLGLSTEDIQNTIRSK